MKPKDPRKRIKGLYKNDPIKGRIPNWKQVVRCSCCARIYRARPLRPKDVEDALAVDSGLLPYPARAILIPYAECPHCYAWHVAEFSTS